MIEKITKLGISQVEAKELLKVSKNIEEDYKKLLKEYPIQYLIGYVNFYGNKINVNENVLIPRYETEYLIEKLVKYIKEKFNNENIDILDLCTGSGCIAISLKKILTSNVIASDISQDALSLAKINSKENNTKIEFVQSDIFQNINKKFDVIVSNPPYISCRENIMYKVKKYEPKLALYAKENGLYFYKEILSNAKKYLKNKYILAFEIGYLQGNDIYNISKKYFPNSNIIIEKDLSDKDRYIFIFSE